MDCHCLVMCYIHVVSFDRVLIPSFLCTTLALNLLLINLHYDTENLDELD